LAPEIRRWPLNSFRHPAKREVRILAVADETMSTKEEMLAGLLVIEV